MLVIRSSFDQVTLFYDYFSRRFPTILDFIIFIYTIVLYLYFYKVDLMFTYLHPDRNSLLILTLKIQRDSDFVFTHFMNLFLCILN